MAEYLLRIVGAFERVVEAESLQEANDKYAEAPFAPSAEGWTFVGLGSAILEDD